MNKDIAKRSDTEALARYRAAARGGGTSASTGRTLRRSVGRPTAAGPDARDPRRLSEVWSQLADGHGWSDEIAIWSLANRWREIVGPQVAEHVVVTEFERMTDPGTAGTGGKLTLRADSNAWQQQMIWNLPHLQRRLDAELGRGVVGGIVVLGPVQRTRRYGSRRV